MADAAHARPNYVAVYLWLIGLLAVSVLAVYLPFSLGITVTIIFLIALAKAVIVAAYFMHMRFDKWLIRSMAIIPVILFVIMTLTLIPDIGLNR
jgi:caa(3)-type oxidase subunit IV